MNPTRLDNAIITITTKQTKLFRSSIQGEWMILLRHFTLKPSHLCSARKNDIQWMYWWISLYASKNGLICIVYNMHFLIRLIELVILYPIQKKKNFFEYYEIFFMDHLNPYIHNIIVPILGKCFKSLRLIVI